GYLAALSKNVELIRWPKKVESQPVELVEGWPPPAIITPSQSADGPLLPVQAANHVLLELGLGRMSGVSVAFQGSIEDVKDPSLLGVNRVIGIIASDVAGQLQSSAPSVLKATGLLAATRSSAPVTLLLMPRDESLQRQAVAQCMAWGPWDIVLLVS